MLRRVLVLAAVCIAVVPAPPAHAEITFAARTYELGAGAGPQSVALADLDGVHGLDLIVAERSTGSVAVLLNASAGPLADPLHYPACPGASDVVVGPIDADFDLDVAVRCDGGAVALLPGLGTGELGPADVQSGMLAADGLTLAQVTPGGPDELVYAADGPSGPMLCWSAHLSGDWAAPQCGDHPPNPDYTPIAGDIAAADLSDPPASRPRDEVITGDYDDAGNILIWGRNPNDAFASWTHGSRPTGDANAPPYTGSPAIMTPDLQSDGDTDVVASYAGSPGGLAVFLWGETGIRPGPGAQYPALAHVVTGGTGDFDGDTLADVAVADAKGHIGAHHGSANGKLAHGDAYRVPDGGGAATDMATGDLDADGRTDIAITEPAVDGVAVLTATGKAPKPHVKPPAPGRKGVGAIPKSIRVTARKVTVGMAKNPPATKTNQRLVAKHGILVAKGVTFIHAGTRVPMKVKLTERGRTLLRELGELKVRLKVVARGTTGRPSKLTRHITLKRRRASQPHSA
jgi:FG-GAP-like repeat